MDRNQQKEEFRQRLYKYILRLVNFLSALPQNVVLREIISQLMASGTSIGANYFEAKGASSKRDYQNFFTYALKSANETIFWLAVLLDSGLVPQERLSECRWLLNETKELARIFASSIITMKGKRTV